MNQKDNKQSRMSSCLHKLGLFGVDHDVVVADVQDEDVAIPVH
jgi:hypothetical protein